MGFYDLPKQKREELVSEMYLNISKSVRDASFNRIIKYASDEDIYIRKGCYLNIGKLYFSETSLKKKLITILTEMFNNPDFRVRQTVVNALGEIGKKEADKTLEIYEKAIFDKHHSVRNAVIGSLKKMGEKNPKPVINFSRKFLHHPDVEVRRQVIHGVELRGRTHPEDVLPLLKDSQWEKVVRVRNMVIHVIGQISYKEGCLVKVVDHLKTWENKEIVKKCLEEILINHNHYPFISQEDKKFAKDYIAKQFPDLQK